MLYIQENTFLVYLIMNLDPSKIDFPPFDLKRLLETVFSCEGNERVCILIDLEDPEDITDFRFLEDETLTIQRKAVEVFYNGLKDGVLNELNYTDGAIYAYKITGGSNLDLPDECYDKSGSQLSLEKDIYPNYDIILCISTNSATAPLTASAKIFGFRGATLHGLNDVILSSGLAVDYNDVSVNAEKLRKGLTQADAFEIDFTVCDNNYTFKVFCNKQEAQKSHGLCRGKTPDIANLPAGEVYYVPEGAEGQFPMKYEDGTIGIMNVQGGRIKNATLVNGNQEVIDNHNEKLLSDPVTGEIGELGLGTQVLPVSGRDIQDEKIFGTIHVATGRSDHLGGHLTPDKFAKAINATHDDILFAPFKTPEINVPEVRMYRNDDVTVVYQNFKPTDYLINLLN